VLVAVKENPGQDGLYWGGLKRLSDLPAIYLKILEHGIGSCAYIIWDVPSADDSGDNRSKDLRCLQTLQRSVELELSLFCAPLLICTINLEGTVQFASITAKTAQSLIAKWSDLILMARRLPSKFQFQGHRIYIISPGLARTSCYGTSSVVG
jgi:hypothetical protein